MWELDCEESRVPKNWCFWAVMLEETLESPSDCKEIRPVRPRGDQSWVFIRRTDVEAETLILWPPHAMSWLTGKDPDVGRDWGQEERMTEDEMVGWHHRLDGQEFEWTPGVGDGQGGLACCDSSDHKELDMILVQFSLVQLLSYVQLFAIAWTEAHQSSLSTINSQSLLKLMSIESVMPSNHFILYFPFSSCPQSFPASGFFFFSSESLLHIRWPKYWTKTYLRIQTQEFKKIYKKGKAKD